MVVYGWATCRILVVVVVSSFVLWWVEGDDLFFVPVLRRTHARTRARQRTVRFVDKKSDFSQSARAGGGVSVKKAFSCARGWGLHGAVLRS
jgi:hypothetical protein